MGRDGLLLRVLQCFSVGLLGVADRVVLRHGHFEGLVELALHALRQERRQHLALPHVFEVPRHLVVEAELTSHRLGGEVGTADDAKF